ncbi:MAG: hypothetical protein PVG87_15370 [Desulfobacteraceae bacterium]|jgi:hypothetical protein
MKEASNDFNGLVKKKVGLGSGRVFKLIILEQAKQRMELANEKEAMGRTIEGSPGVPGVTEGLATAVDSMREGFIPWITVGLVTATFTLSSFSVKNLA